MPEPTRSEGWLLDPIRTQMFVADEDDLQVMLASVSKWELFVYQNEAEKPYWSATGQHPSLIMFDTLRTWPLGPPGYNAEHWLFYDRDGFKPIGGTTSRLEFVFYRVALGPGLPLRPITFVHLRTHKNTRTRTLRYA